MSRLCDYVAEKLSPFPNQLRQLGEEHIGDSALSCAAILLLSLHPQKLLVCLLLHRSLTLLWFLCGKIYIRGPRLVPDELGFILVEVGQESLALPRVLHKVLQDMEQSISCTLGRLCVV